MAPYEDRVEQFHLFWALRRQLASGHLLWLLRPLSRLSEAAMSAP